MCITWIIIECNNFEFTSKRDLILINIVINHFWLFFSLIRVVKNFISSKLLKLLGSIWNFRTLMQVTINYQIVLYNSSLVSFFLFSEGDYAKQRLWCDDCSDFCSPSLFSVLLFSFLARLVMYCAVNCCL